MADRALTEADWKQLRALLMTRLSYADYPLFQRLEAEHAALREVARVADEFFRMRAMEGELRAALAALEAKHPGVLGGEG